MGQAGFAEAKPKLSAEERGNSIVILGYLNSWRLYFLENPIYKKWMMCLGYPYFRKLPNDPKGSMAGKWSPSHIEEHCTCSIFGVYFAILGQSHMANHPNMIKHGLRRNSGLEILRISPDHCSMFFHEFPSGSKNFHLTSKTTRLRHGKFPPAWSSAHFFWMKPPVAGWLRGWSCFVATSEVAADVCAARLTFFHVFPREIPARSGIIGIHVTRIFFWHSIALKSQSTYHRVNCNHMYIYIYNYILCWFLHMSFPLRTGWFIETTAEIIESTEVSWVMVPP